MAVIGKIRQHSGLLVGLIGLSIVGFLVMDATNSQFSVLKGRNTLVGEVNGEKIEYNDFSKKVEDNTKTMEERMGNGQTLSDEDRNYVRIQTWNDMVNEIIFSGLYDALGMNVTDDEMLELVQGKNPHPYVRQSFSNPQTQQFDAQQVKLFIQNLDNDDPGTEPGTRRKMWLNFEKEVKKDQFRQKYNNLIAKGLFAPAWMQQMAFRDQNQTMSLKFFSLPYASVPESEVKLSDEDLSAYLKEHAARYSQDEETRKLQFVTFSIQPSSKDTADVLRYLGEKMAEFSSAESDSIFARLYSEEQFDGVYYPKANVAPEIADTVFVSPVKSIIGPYMSGNMMKLAKITDRKMISDSLRLREIVFDFSQVKSQEEANAKRAVFDSVFMLADSLKQDFAMLAAQFSEDQTKKATGGDIGWVKRGEKEKSYNDEVFYRGSKGSVHRAGTQTSLIIVQVAEDRPTTPAVKLTYLSKTVLPSPETEKEIYANASKFASDNQTADKFRKSGEKQGMKAAESLRKEDFNVFGLGSARELVRWAYEAEEGSVSPVISADKMHVVALLDKVNPKGLAPLEAVKEKVRIEAAQDKRVEILKKKIEAAKSGNFDEWASKAGSVTNVADNVSFSNPTLGNMGYEPNVAAAAVNLKLNTPSVSVKGNTGVYVVVKTSENNPEAPKDLGMYAAQLKGQQAGKAGRVAEVQKKLADVEDRRFEFF